MSDVAIRQRSSAGPILRRTFSKDQRCVHNTQGQHQRSEVRITRPEVVDAVHQRISVEQQRLQANHDHVFCGNRQMTDNNRQPREVEADKLDRQVDSYAAAESAAGSDERLAIHEDSYRQLWSEHAELQAKYRNLRTQSAEFAQEREELQACINELSIQLQKALEGHQSQGLDLEPVEQADSPTSQPTSDSVAEEPQSPDDFEIDEDVTVNGQGLGDELVENDDIEAQTLDTVQELRSQMAAMFGIEADKLGSLPTPVDSTLEVEQTCSDGPGRDQEADDEQLEADGGTDDEPQAEAASDPASAPLPQLDADNPEAIADYMRHLIARNRRDVPQDRPAPVQPASRSSQPASDDHTSTKSAGKDGKKVAETGDSASDRADRQAPRQVSETTDALQPGAPRRMLDPEWERQHRHSLRELANQSARSAVAKHNSTELRTERLIQGVVVGACLVTTIVLLSSPYWSRTSFVHWGTVTALLTALMIWKISETTVLMRKNLASQKTPNRNEATVSQQATSCDTASQMDVDENVTRITAAGDELLPDEDGETLPSSTNASPPSLAFEDDIPR